MPSIVQVRQGVCCRIKSRSPGPRVIRFMLRSSRGLRNALLGAIALLGGHDVACGQSIEVSPASASGTGVSSVTNSDGTVTVSPSTGAVVINLNLGNANSWTAPQTFQDIIITGTPSGTTSLSITQSQTLSGSTNHPAITTHSTALGTTTAPL